MKKKISLPNPKKKGDLSLEEAISNRRTERDLVEEPLSLTEISQILWAGQGITDPGKIKRAAPSAGATYPFSIYLSVKNVDGLNSGIYKYIQKEDELKFVKEEDFKKIKKVAFEQSFIEKAGVNLLLAADYKRTTDSYGDRGVRYVHMEAGHIAQNICLQAESLSLSTVLVGSFDDEKIADIFELKQEKPVYILSIGKSK